MKKIEIVIRPSFLPVITDLLQDYQLECEEIRVANFSRKSSLHNHEKKHESYPMVKVDVLVDDNKVTEISEVLQTAVRLIENNPYMDIYVSEPPTISEIDKSTWTL